VDGQPGVIYAVQIAVVPRQQGITPMRFHGSGERHAL